jgi:hypothetical protein
VQVGNSPDVASQQRAESHFGLWAIVKAPLLIGADLRQIDKVSLDVLKSQEVIAVNQDALGVAADVIYMRGDVQIFAAPLAGGARALLFFNRERLGDAITASVSWKQLGYPKGLTVQARDLFRAQDKGVGRDQLSVTVPADSVVFLKLQPQLASWCDEDASSGHREQPEERRLSSNIDATTADARIRTSPEDRDTTGRIDVVDDAGSGVVTSSDGGRDVAGWASGEGRRAKDRGGLLASVPHGAIECEEQLIADLDAWRPFQPASGAA